MTFRTVTVVLTVVLQSAVWQLHVTTTEKKRPSLFMPDTAGRAQTARGKLFPATIHQKTGFFSVTIHFPANPREV